MKILFAILVFLLTLGLGIGDAEAKRLGGGKSSGVQRQTTSANKAPDTKTAQTPAAPSATPTQPKRSWMGPLAGIAAGLGLAALASHLGFGQELASALLIGLALVAVLAIVGLIMRRRAAAQQPLATPGRSLQYAGVGADAAPGVAKGYEVSMPGSSIGTKINTTSGIPADFDVDGFERTAKLHFIRLQAANDAANLDEIRVFTTPEIFTQIQLDIAERGGAPQQTELVSIEAKVIEVVEEEYRYLVSVRFNGIIRDSAEALPEPFEETWHLVKPRDGTGGWVLGGIQQL